MTVLDPKGVNDQQPPEWQVSNFSALPRIFEYDNYRTYLRDYYHFHKQTLPDFSLRYFCQKAGYRSGSFFRMVMRAERDLSDDGIDRFARALELSAAEADFFRLLVKFNQASSIEQKQRFAHEMMRSKTFQRLRPLAKAKFEYWSQWYNVVIRELVAIAGFREDPAWIAEQLSPHISAEQAASALRQLLTLDLLRRDENGRLRISEGDVTSGDEMTHTCLGKFHREMIEKGQEAIDRFAKPERLIAGVTAALDAAHLEKARQAVQRCRQEILTLAHQCENPTRIVQINFQLFPTTEEISS